MFSMRRLSDAAPTMLSGTMSTNGCSGPRAPGLRRQRLPFRDIALIVSCNRTRTLSGTMAPGFIRLTSTSPMIRATSVVPR